MSLSSSQPRHHHVTVTCKAEGMYPEPEVSLLIQRSRFERSVSRDEVPFKCPDSGVSRDLMSAVMGEDGS